MIATPAKTYLSKDMSSTTHVFVRHDAIHKLLQPPYSNPYRVLKQADKLCMLDITGHPEVVSLDHLKPAYLESDLITDVDMSTQAKSTMQPMKSSVPICALIVDCIS